MRTYDILSSAAFLRIAVKSGKGFNLRVSWATDLGLLSDPPALPRTTDNYSESPILEVNWSASPARPALVAADLGWWQQVREKSRQIYAQVDWQALTPNSPWTPLDIFQFMVNHPPEAVVGSDQIVEVDSNDNLLMDVNLDGSDSSDPDGSGLTYTWSMVQYPPTISKAGVVWANAQNLPSEQTPSFLSAGTKIPQSDRGNFSFRLLVDDGETATIGLKAGQTGQAVAECRVLLGADTGANLSLLSPTKASPFLGNFEDGVDIPIYYTVGQAILSNPAFQNGWAVRCTIRQSVEGFFLTTALSGDPVHEITQVPLPFSVEMIRWDGRDTVSPLCLGSPANGAFKVRLDLVDCNGNVAKDANGRQLAGTFVEEDNAIVLDKFRWLMPVGGASSDVMQSGAFMESGHGGVHGGVDLTSSQVLRGLAQPDFVASRSGFYGFLADAYNTVVLTHAKPDTTYYLHGVNLAVIANGNLVLQGQRLGTVGATGTVAAHHHFEHHTTNPEVKWNPLAIITAIDVFAPTIEGIFMRQAQVPAVPVTPASLLAAALGISGSVDFIIRCRDRAHPDRPHSASSVENGPYRVWLREYTPTGIVERPGLRFDFCTAATRVGDSFALQGVNSPLGGANDLRNHYLPYLRIDTTAYQASSGPLKFDVCVADFRGNTAVQTIVLGPDASLSTPPPDPATTHASPGPFVIGIQVINRTDKLNSNSNAQPADPDFWLASDDYHLSLANAPAGWTVSRTGAPAASAQRTGPISNGNTQVVQLTIDPHGHAPVGTCNIEVVVSSNILTDVASRVAISVRIS